MCVWHINNLSSATVLFLHIKLLLRVPALKFRSVALCIDKSMPTAHVGINQATLYNIQTRIEACCRQTMSRLSCMRFSSHPLDFGGLNHNEKSEMIA